MMKHHKILKEKIWLNFPILGNHFRTFEAQCKKPCFLSLIHHSEHLILALVRLIILIRWGAWMFNLKELSCSKIQQFNGQALLALGCCLTECLHLENLNGEDIYNLMSKTYLNSLLVLRLMSRLFTIFLINKLGRINHARGLEPS